MKLTSKLFLFIVAVFLHSGFSQHSDVRDDSMVYLKSNLEFLASDLLEGRETGTRGTQLASSFIVSELKKYGVKPFGDDGNYFQNFYLLAKKFSEYSSISIINNGKRQETLSIGDDFFISQEYLPSNKYLDNKDEREVVFVRYGIDARDYDYNDYKNTDVKGKIVLLLQGLPAQNGSNVFSSTDAKMFNSEEYKLNTAVEHGAEGVMLIPTESTIKYWKYIKNEAVTTSDEIIEGEVNNIKLAGSSIPLIKLSEQAVTKLLEGEKYNFESLKRAVSGYNIPDSFLLTKQLVMDLDFAVNIVQARNVIGIIKGNNDHLKDQYVTFSAHYDHEGIVKGEIYNGADDNGSGTVTILEAARRLSILKENKRSILVIFHTGEEKGLLGSQYLTENSPFMKDIVANINIDMVGREETDQIYCIGSDKLSTELFNLVEEVNGETSQFTLDYKYNDPFDPNKYYYRSDHYNYAKHRIPIVFFYDHMTEDYHKPTDDVEKINFKKIEKGATLITELALRIANLDHRLIVDK